MNDLMMLWRKRILAILGIVKAGEREHREIANMEWLVNLVQGHTDAPLCIDSANPKAIAKGLALVKQKPIVNSVSLEAERLREFLPIVQAHECMVVALCMADDGMPKGADARMQRAEQLIGHLTAAGKKLDELIIDPCFLPVSAEPDDAQYVLSRTHGVAAFFGASSMERLPTEVAITENMRRFKRITRQAGAAG